ncbi:DBH-like monooxygenase protein 1 homolog [Uloborus diversus]|uniref:DBH-like monooxygenase protein 1 homolog n=1 Tax=Uloborus diversus TaxID=327109 RepID=UPI00240973BB|nr:DBH-like monooxygenase protein 1 homolog [Uloborus diversus]
MFVLSNFRRQLRTFYVFLLTFISCFCFVNANDYYHEVLDRHNHYHLYWRVDKLNEKIIFRVEVLTRGYVALGFSPNGGMPGSDIVIGWVQNGKVFLQDRYAHKNGLPLLDDQADWELLSGFENNTHTVLEVSRKFDTCDPQDFPVTNDTTRVIYAYHDEDPVSDELITYHGREKRGSKSLILLQPLTSRHELPNDVKIWYIRSPNVTIPDDVDTTYWCKIVKAPLLNKKHHVIQVEPLISEESASYVHHMVLYRCLGATARELEPHVHHTGHPCYVPDMPHTYTKCESVYTAWGVGGLALVMPERAGLPLGDKPNLYFLLEIHYDNSEFHSGVVDQSGFRVYFTPNLRRYDAMTLMIGASVDPCIVIPPRRRKFTIAGHADPNCLGPAIPPEGIRIFAVFLHSHLLGRQMKLRHFRNSVELPHIASDQRFDFNYQEYRYLPQEVIVKSGDHLIVECTYDSSGRNVTTFGGLGTSQEMCLAFVLYYPRIARARSLSSATCDLVKSLAGMELKYSHADDDNSNLTFYQHFQKNNPWDSNYACIAEAAMRFGYHTTQCFLGDGRRLDVPGLVTYPRNIRAYNEPSRCSYVVSSQELWKDSFSDSAGSSLKSTWIFTAFAVFLFTSSFKRSYDHLLSFFHHFIC